MNRRGVALLLVLAVLVCAVAAAAGAARVSIATRAGARVSESAREADTWMIGAAGAIDRFLRVESARVVLGPGVREPELRVLEDRVRVRGRWVEIRVTAYDQCGMVPWTQMQGDSGLCEALDPVAVSVLGGGAARTGPRELDLLPSMARQEGLAVFPGGAAAESTGRLALGATVATHNPDPGSLSLAAQPTGGLINVNTAPAPLLRSALAPADRGQLSEILAARARGEAATLPPAHPGSIGRGDPRRIHPSIRLVGQSDAWSFRVDVAVGGVRRSWWLVYRAVGAQWRCVQRVAISE